MSDRELARAIDDLIEGESRPVQERAPVVKWGVVYGIHSSPSSVDVIVDGAVIPNLRYADVFPTSGAGVLTAGDVVGLIGDGTDKVVFLRLQP